MGECGGFLRRLAGENNSKRTLNMNLNLKGKMPWSVAAMEALARLVPSNWLPWEPT